MKNNKVIVIAGNRFITQKQGGVEFQTYYIGKALVENGWDVNYICPGENTMNNTPLKYENMKVWFYKQPRFMWKIPKIRIMELLNLIQPSEIYQRGKNDLIWKMFIINEARRIGSRYTLGLSSDSDVSCFSLKYINFIQQKNIFKKMSYFVHSIINDYYFRKTIKSASRIIVQHEYQYLGLKNILPDEKIIELKTQHPILKNNIRKSTALTLIWVNNTRPGKQPEIFIELAKKLNKSFSRIDYIMILGNSKNEYCEKIEKDVAEIHNLQLLRNVDKKNVEKYLEISSLFINTSIKDLEGFPNTFVQSWLRETPVVSLNIDPGGIITNEGLGIYTKGNKNILFNETYDLLKKPEDLLKMGIKCRKYAELNHGLDNNGHKINEIFIK